jgi:hypothetical protein
VLHQSLITILKTQTIPKFEYLNRFRPTDVHAAMDDVKVASENNIWARFESMRHFSESTKIG